MNSDDERQIRDKDQDHSKGTMINNHSQSEGEDGEKEQEEIKTQKETQDNDKEKDQMLSKQKKDGNIQISNLIPERLERFGLIQQIREKTQAPLYRVCLTGGPCAGKTSALKFLQKELSREGFIVYIIPETPTLTMEGGGMIQMASLKEKQILSFQTNLIRFQIQAEDYFLRIALMQDKPAVVLCDRGTCDPKAYVSRDQWQVILDQEGWNTNTLRDFRYDAVIHLVTAASGAEKFYHQDNKARYESLEQARNADERVLKAYVGHPHHLIIDNSMEPKSFQTKLSRVTNQLKKIIGLDYDKSFNKSFLLNNCNNLYHYLSISSPLIDSLDDIINSLYKNKLAFKDYTMDMYLLQTQEVDAKEYIVKRGNQNFTYCHILKRDNPNLKDPNKSQEQCTAITPFEYQVLTKNKMVGTHRIVANVVAFAYNQQQWILQTKQRCKFFRLRYTTGRRGVGCRYCIYRRIKKQRIQISPFSLELIKKYQ